MSKIIRSISPNAGINAKYRKRLLKELEDMQRSISYWLKSAYTAREDEIVADDMLTMDSSPI